MLFNISFDKIKVYNHVHTTIKGNRLLHVTQFTLKHISNVHKKKKKKKNINALVSNKIRHI